MSVPCSEFANVMLAGALENCHVDNKVSSILMAIRKALQERFTESPARELCILTTLARSEPPLLEDALKAIREKELSHADDHMRVSYPSAEEALKHLLWLADGDAVYDAALGLYDLKLIAIVALNAQKDPKEFLPFLQELERMPTQLMQYQCKTERNLVKRKQKPDGRVHNVGISYQIINVEPGKTYRIRVHNVGISTSLNFRIQNHNHSSVSKLQPFTN